MKNSKIGVMTFATSNFYKSSKSNKLLRNYKNRKKEVLIDISMYLDSNE